MRLYRTTRQFLRAFHLSSLDDLPEMPDLAGDGQLRLGDDGMLLGSDGEEYGNPAAELAEDTREN